MGDIWDGYGWWRCYDQLQNIVNELKDNPDSRRLLVSAWNVADVDSVTLPPCHIRFYVSIYYNTIKAINRI